MLCNFLFSPSASHSLTRLNCLREVRSPLRPTCLRAAHRQAGFSVYASPVLFTKKAYHSPSSGSATGATLNRGGWLDLTPQGLPSQGWQVTLQEAPSFAWRTNVRMSSGELKPETTIKVQRKTEIDNHHGISCLLNLLVSDSHCDAKKPPIIAKIGFNFF